MSDTPKTPEALQLESRLKDSRLESEAESIKLGYSKNDPEGRGFKIGYQYGVLTERTRPLTQEQREAIRLALHSYYANKQSLDSCIDAIVTALGKGTDG